MRRERMSEMVVAAVVIIVLAGAAVYAVSRSRMNPGKTETAKPARSNVISMEGHRRAKQNATEQLCSSCRKKNGKLIFYAQDDGSVVGLCKDCKAKAKKRDMLPL